MGSGRLNINLLGHGGCPDIRKIDWISMCGVSEIEYQCVRSRRLSGYQCLGSQKLSRHFMDDRSPKDWADTSSMCGVTSWMCAVKVVVDTSVRGRVITETVQTLRGCVEWHWLSGYFVDVQSGTGYLVTSWMRRVTDII